MNVLSTKEASFGWELINLESQLKSAKSAEEERLLEAEIAKIYLYREATKKMAKATKLHDRGSYKKAKSLYNEVLTTDVFYAEMAKENLSRIS